MTEARAGGSSRRPARHERPAIDEAGLVAARHADRLLAAARAIGSERWIAYLEPLPDRLRDDDPSALRATATRVPGGLRRQGFDPRRAAGGA